jgi:hypothetical protein
VDKLLILNNGFVSVNEAEPFYFCPRVQNLYADISSAVPLK